MVLTRFLSATFAITIKDYELVLNYSYSLWLIWTGLSVEMKNFKTLIGLSIKHG